MADSTQFQIDIDVPSGGTNAAADAVARLKSQLEAAGAASTAAADAVKKGEAAYSQAERAANSAALAVERIGQKADAQRGKLEAAMKAGDETAFWRAAAAIDKLTASQAEAVRKSEAAKASLAGEAASLDQLRVAAKQAEAAESQLEKAHGATKKAADAQQKAQDAANANLGKVNELAEGFGKLGGPAGAAGQKIFGLAEGFKKLGSSAGAAGPYVAIAIAIVAIATAAITATIAVTAWAVSLSDAADTQSRLYQGMVQSVAGGQALEASVTRLASRVPLTNDKLKSMASELAKTGLRGKELEDALESAAVKASEAEFGPEWAKQVNSLDKLSERFKGHLSGLFRLKTDALQEGLGRLVSLFDETSATGKAIKVVFDSLMQPLIDGLTDLVPIIVKTFIQFEIWALRALIAIKPYGSTIAAAAKGLGALAAVILGVVVAAFVIVGAVAAVFLTVVSTVWQAIIALGKSLLDTASFVLSFRGAIGGAIDWLSGLDLVAIGLDLIRGLSNGILGGGPAVLEAMTNIVGGAVDSAKKLLGIASPSKVFAQIGAYTAEGMAQGVDSGASNVQGSIDSMVAPPSATPTLGGTSTTTHAGGNTFYISVGAGGDPKGIGAEVRAQIQAFFDGMVDQVGAGEPA